MAVQKAEQKALRTAHPKAAWKVERVLQKAVLTVRQWVDTMAHPTALTKAAPKVQ
jgi:hypothetical protein